MLAAAQVGRTGPGNLPVYTSITRGGSKVVTQVRLVEGDLQALSAELSELCSAKAVVKPTGSSVDVSGNHVGAVKGWLQQQGF